MAVDFGRCWGQARNRKAPSSAVRRTQKSLATLQSVDSRVGSGLLRSRCLLGCILFDIPARLLLSAAGNGCFRICGVERVAVIA